MARSLAAYVAALVAAVDRHDAYAALRLRAVAGSRRARIGLDGERVLVRFDGDRLAVEPDQPGAPVDGEGYTDSGTVRELLAGRLEGSTAVLSGAVHVVGAPEAVAAMLHLVEILLDVSLREPELQDLARDLLGTRAQAGLPDSRDYGVAWYPEEVTPAAMDLLARLDLLPE
ncbi:MAG: hypothetical protein ACOYY2_14260 [Actinomycetota bacterium]